MQAVIPAQAGMTRKDLLRNASNKITLIIQKKPEAFHLLADHKIYFLLKMAIPLRRFNASLSS